MVKTPEDHAGSGLDKPDPKTLLEKLGDGVKSVLPKAKTVQPTKEVETGNGEIVRYRDERHGFTELRQR